MTKLAKFFVSDSPSSNLVESLAEVYLNSGTSIKAVLTYLANSPEFLTSERLRVRTPVADLVATARVLDVQVEARVDNNSWVNQANYIHGADRLFSWPRPDGPPLTSWPWCSASRMFASFKMHENLSGGWCPKQAQYRTGASWIPAETVQFDAFVDHLCLGAWLGKPK